MSDIRATGRTASSPVEVYRTASDRLMESVGASFASVYLRDHQDPGVLRLATARNWPQPWARFLSEVRVKEGRGPTGLAFVESRPIEVEDVFDDPELEEWWEAARELGFVSVAAFPLLVEEAPVGTLTFYFGERRVFEPRGRKFLTRAARETAEAASEVGKHT